MLHSSGYSSLSVTVLPGMFPDTESSSAAPPPRSDRLVALFLAGLMALNPPLMRAFGGDATVFGMPLVVFYVFVVWAGLIGLVAWHVERAERGPRESTKKDDE